MNAKIKSLNQISLITKKSKNDGKKVGLITGCFDIVHLGHLNFFRFAKKKIDILIIGVENDESVKISKGITRPINSLQERMDFLSEISLVDYIFPIDRKTLEPEKFYTQLLQKINPNYLIISLPTDKFWQRKKQIALNLGIKFLPFTRKIKISSSKIIEKLEKEL